MSNFYDLAHEGNSITLPRVVFQGDPRGAVVKLQVPSGKTDDWGQMELCVPA